MNVPNIALNNVTINTEYPLPTKAKIGAGHAPVSAQPNPNIKPPNIVPL